MTATAGRTSNAFPGLEQRVLARWRLRPGAAPQPMTVLVGFSGGGDSLALALVMRAIAARAALTPTLLHVDHGFRHASADEAERAVRLGDQIGLLTRIVRLPDRSWERHSGVGPEEALRRERYRVFATALVDANAAALVLAHHADDQAETVLLHLLRGAGVTGAGGMGEWTSRVVPWWPERDTNEDPADESNPTKRDDARHRLAVWRPLLNEARAELRIYAAASGLVPIEDPSNDDPRFRRNALRREALPLLERIVPGASAALARFASLAAEDDATLQRQADALLADALLADARPADGSLRLSILDGQPPAIRRRVVRTWLVARCALPVPTAERTAAVLDLCGIGDIGRSVELTGGYRVVRDRGALRFVDGRGGDGG